MEIHFFVFFMKKNLTLNLYYVECALASRTTTQSLKPPSIERLKAVTYTSHYNGVFDEDLIDEATQIKLHFLSKTS